MLRMGKAVTAIMDVAAADEASTTSEYDSRTGLLIPRDPVAGRLLLGMRGKTYCDLTRQSISYFTACSRPFDLCLLSCFGQLCSKAP